MQSRNTIFAVPFPDWNTLVTAETCFLLPGCNPTVCHTENIYSCPSWNSTKEQGCSGMKLFVQLLYFWVSCLSRYILYSFTGNLSFFFLSFLFHSSSVSLSLSLQRGKFEHYFARERIMTVENSSVENSKTLLINLDTSWNLQSLRLISSAILSPCHTFLSLLNVGMLLKHASRLKPFLFIGQSLKL